MSVWRVVAIKRPCSDGEDATVDSGLGNLCHEEFAVIADTSHARVDLPDCHFYGGKGPKQGYVTHQPFVIVFRRQDDGHASMQVGHQ
jgi:hypothetical protein